MLPVESGTSVSGLSLSWNCKTIPALGRLGPATDYDIQARDPITGIFYDVAFVREPRTAEGAQMNSLVNPVVTDQLLLHLKTRELGVDFYSLREVQLRNGSAAVSMKLPTALNSLGGYDILRSFDGDLASQWVSGTQGSVTAFYAIGSNLKFTDLRVIGFGTKAGRECFPLFIQTAPPWVPAPAGFGNVLVENCLFTDPAPDNADDVTTICVAGRPFRAMTNTVIRGCSVTGLKSHFTISQAFSALNVENCFVDDCTQAFYFEPELTDDTGPVTIRSNLFLNVVAGVSIGFHAGAQFESINCTDNEFVLSGGNGWAFAACDTCDVGPSGSIGSVTALNNIVRYPDWSLQPANSDAGLFYSDIHNAVFGNNIVSLGTAGALGVRPFPAGYIPPPIVAETCDSPGSSGSFSYPPSVDILPPGYRRAWFNNRDLNGNLLNVRYSYFGSDGLAAQQQWP